MKNIFIRIRNKDFTHYYAFSLSATGTLDYIGKTEAPNIERLQEIESSTYFSPSSYTYAPSAYQSEIHVLFENDVDLANADLFAFLTHVGALILATEVNDGLLVAELLHRRAKIFFAFLPLTLYIIKPIAPLALFAWSYGRFSQSDGLQKVFEKGFTSPKANAEEILFAAAAEKLDPKPEKETADEMFIRYLGTLELGEFTLGIVGGSHYPWNNGISEIDDYLKDAIEKDLLNETSFVGEKMSRFFAKLKVSVKAEPHNPYDPNAIGVFIEDIKGKLHGNVGKTKAGYIRATGASLLRKAFPRKLAYEASLARLGNLGADTDFDTEGVTLRIKF